MEAQSKLEAFLKGHGFNMAAVARAAGIASRGDFRNRMTGREWKPGKSFTFTEEQKRRIAEFVRADISELF